MPEGPLTGAKILGSSKWHIVQRVGNSPKTAGRTSEEPPGDHHAVFGTVEITIRREKGAVTQIVERQRRHAQGKELALRR